MSSSNTLTPAEARRVVEGIARRKGWISREAREATPQESLEAINHLQQVLGASVEFAKTLYSSQARFVFELIQNAEDNHYTRAASSGTEPYIRFTLYPDKIVIDSNEDGFTPENVRAICEIGGSTKLQSGAQQYIGEKGIGFKSVFMVASEVHIQSGPFSFFFEHRPGGSGMGMITPQWEEPCEALQDISTRITLTLLDKLDYQDLISEFRALPDTFLLFFTKLNQITIIQTGFANSSSESITYARTLDESSQRATLTKLHRIGTEATQTVLKYYHITRKSFDNLPLDDHRNYNTAEVVLAFPLDKNWVPIIDRQNVYAYLPIRDFGFRFLIQSDFVTQASRQDVMGSSRNKAVLERVAEVFLDAVFQFCDHRTLQYHWPSYILNDISDPFWMKLRDQIHALLKSHPILRGWSKGPLRHIHQLKFVPTRYKDINGDPLFRDLNREMYLAPEYPAGARAVLRSLGLRTMNKSDFLKRFRRDLQMESSVSSYKSEETADDWHTRVANILLSAYDEESTDMIDEIEKLTIIPLQSGEWTSVTAGDVFLPDTDGMLIPTDLGLRIVDGQALTNSARKKLFVKMGIKPAPTERVRNMILQLHGTHNVSVDLESSVKHIHYLYWTTPPVTGEAPRNLRELGGGLSLRIFNHRGELASYKEDLYVPTEDEYGFQQLIGSDLEKLPNITESVGSFIHSEYQKSVPIQPNSNHISWETWLERWLAILFQPRLTDPEDPSQPSQVFRYIIDRQPEKILGTLKAHWAVYKDQINDELAEEISNVEIPNTHIGARALWNTYLPSKNLVGKCSKFLDFKHFPFLDLDDVTRPMEWRFLEVFQVGVNATLNFYLDILYFCKFTKSLFRYEIYEAIQRKIMDSSTSEADKGKVREYISEEDLVLVPASSGGSSKWTHPGRCLWDAPDYMTKRHPLLPRLSGVNNPTLTAFFNDTLGVENASWLDYIKELIAIKKNKEPMIETVRDIYHRLQSIASTLDSQLLESLRRRFERLALIYTLPRKIWGGPSSCLWSENAQIPGKNTISGQYPDLEDFFVRTLKVKIPDLGLLVEELKRTVESSRSVDDVKSLIWQINSFIPAGKALNILYDSDILPVKAADGKLDLRSRTGKFSIRDRQSWADIFKSKIDFLDFSLKEVRLLQPFLSCLDLEERYLSQIVVEKSSFRGELSDPSSKRTKHLRRRAHALARCATHFNSPRAKNDSQSVYQKLLHANVFETEGIIGSLEHSLLGEKVVVDVSTTKLHIEENQVRLNIYVPKDRRDQEICYLRVLPTKLFNEVMMERPASNSTLAADPSAVAILISVFAASDQVIDSVLEEAGIVPVLYADEYEEQNEDSRPDQAPSSPEIEAQADADSETESGDSVTTSGAGTPEATVSSNRSASLSPLSISTARASFRPDSQARPVRGSVIQATSPSRTPEYAARGVGRTPLTPGSSDSEYRRLLSNVIKAARKKKGGFPSQGHFNLDDLRNALPVDVSTDPDTYDLPFGVRNENQLAYDMKIGAAGELYAFEILSRLSTSLPSFGRENWQSTIRKHVTIHEKYQDMEPWRGAETADITYHDTEGEFTRLLIENGYLDERTWVDARPKYFLEVKTTMKECGARFFVSRSQYQRMQRMKFEGAAKAEVYIIFRVFQLGDEIDMRLYIDPIGMEERGELRFVSESYSVVPLAVAS